MSLERYKKNPFLENMIVPVKGKQVQLSRLGRDENILVNHKTGEIQGTHVTTVKRVDSEQFVKLFTAPLLHCSTVPMASCTPTHLLLDGKNDTSVHSPKIKQHEFKFLKN